MLLLEQPPKMVFAPNGELVEVTISASAYRSYLRYIAENTDWDALPVHLQDAIDSMLIDEVRSEKTSVLDFTSILTPQ